MSKEKFRENLLRWTLYENASLHEQKQYSAKYKENRIA